MSVFTESGSYRPFLYPKLVEMAKVHQIDMHWTENQVELTDDLRQYNAKDGLKTSTASHETNKHIIDSVLCLFTELDKTVAGGYAQLLPYAGNNEVRNWFLTAGSREVIHQRAYALAAETFGFAESDWVAFRDYKVMQDKIDTMSVVCVLEGKGGVNKLDFAVELARLLLGEGIGLFAAFATLLNFKRSGLLIGTNDINQWSLLDENEHVAGNIIVLNAVRKELSVAENRELDKAIEILIMDYIEAELAFIELVYEMGEPEGMTKADLKGYIEYPGRFRGVQLGVLPEWQLGTNPMPWIEFMLSGKNHDNFFEKRVTDYSHAGLSGTIDYKQYEDLL